MSAYETILAAMYGRYQEETGFSPDNASDAGIRMKALAVELANLSGQVEELHRQVFPQTAHGQALDYHAQTRGLARKAASPASGTLRFSRESAAPGEIVVPEGVACSVSRDGDLELRYVTTASGVIPAGGTSVDLPARSLQGGGDTNAAPGAISVMITPVQGVTSVTNPLAFTGGGDGETDSQLRDRLLQSFASISNGTNAAFYYDFAMSFEGVSSVQVVPREKGRGTVGLYVAGPGAAASAQLVESIQNALTQAKEINVDVTVHSAAVFPVNVALEAAPLPGADFELLQAALRERLERCFLERGVGESLLLSGLAEALYHTPGLYNYKLAAPASDLESVKGRLFTLGEVSITRMAVVV